MEYILSTNNQSQDTVKKLITSNFKIEDIKTTNNKNSINLDYNKTLGFSILLVTYPKRVVCLSAEFFFDTSIIFRLDKDEYYRNTAIQKRNMIAMLLLLVTHLKQCIFTFNGENLLLLKDKNGKVKVKVNKYFAFWDNQEQMLNKITYETINNNEEIDYYPIK